MASFSTVLALAAVGLPAAAAAVSAWLGWRDATVRVGTVAAGGMVAAALALTAMVARGESVEALGGLVRIDAVGAFMLTVIGVVGLLTAVAGPAYLTAELETGHMSVRAAGRHSFLVLAFLATMALAVVAANLGVIWVAVEATTVVTAFLVGQGRSRAAVEAAWKYVVICSVGIALAFLGIVVLNYASAQTASPAGLDLVRLTESAGSLDPGATRIAIALLVVGFGTKVGIAPLHAWLPDAHSQAPAPVSALMSGVLLSVAFYAVLRVKVVADAALGTGFTRNLLLVMALTTLVLAASLLLAQRDYKRMLAYSSMEHMALLAFGAAAGGRLALAGVLLHMLGHGLIKAVLFLGAGRLLQRTGSRSVDDIRGLASRDPALAAPLGIGILALVGFPPFSMFASKLAIFGAGFRADLTWVTAGALLLVLIITAALLTHTARMLLGEPTADDSMPDAGHDMAEAGPGPGGRPVTTSRTTATGLLVACIAGPVAAAGLGIAAGPFQSVLLHAAEILGG